MCADAAGGFPLSGARSWDVQHIRAHGVTASKCKSGHGRFREAWDADAAASSRKKRRERLNFKRSESALLKVQAEVRLKVMAKPVSSHGTAQRMTHTAPWETSTEIFLAS